MEKYNLYNLTNPQNSIYLTEEYASGSSVNLISGDVIIDEKVDFDLLEKALNLFVQRNDAIRIRICMNNNKPKQYIHEYMPFTLKKVFISDPSELYKFNTDIINRSFNFFDSDLFWFTLFKFNDNSGGFNVTFHHIITDAWSMSLFVDEVIEIYSKLLKKEEIALKSDYSYLDFIKSEEEYKNTSRFQKDQAFWNECFDSEPELALVSDKKTQIVSTKAKRKSYTLDNNLYSKINELCKKYRCSIYTFFMAIYSLYLAKINNTDSSIIGTPILNRSNFKEKNTLGLFVSTLPFYVKIDFNDRFYEYLQKISDNQMKFFRHQRYPYSTLLENLKKKYNFSYNLYDLAISYQNARINKNELDVKFHTDWFFNNNCSDTLQIHFYDLDDTGIINIYYDYQIAKLSENDIENIHNRILNIIAQIIDNPELILNSLDIVSPEEKKLIWDSFNNVVVKHPRNINVYSLIEEIGKKYPNNIAVKYKNESITYKDLILRSNQIAKNLVKKGVKKGNCVSILLAKKNIDLIVSMLGVLRAGASFLAIYPEYPNERIEYILKDSNTKVLITEHYFDNKCFDANKLYISDLENITTDINFPEACNDDPAYIIYTSGSTGKPKGTIQTHNNLINFVYSFNYYLDNSISNKDQFLSVTNICFDVSMAEIFTALIFGCTLYLYKDLNNSSISELGEYIYKNNITFAYFPPAMLHSIYDELKKYSNLSLNKMLVGVEPIKASTLSDFLNLNSEMKIVNGYGPSETTICCTMYKFDNTLQPDSITPIGHPIGNSKIFILDKLKKLVPIGKIGEIYVKGECVGNGYLNNPIKTAEAFDLENRIYKTGDSAKWLPDGTIIFVGRNDNQIKYRGYRIDLGEIENTIKNIPGVKNCIVLLDKLEVEPSRLIAFIILDESKLNEEDFRNILIEKLPHYMIPNQFKFLKSFPLNTNGKIDRSELLKMVNESSEQDYVAPRTETEKIMCDIWSNVLKRPKIGIEDNFFAIGGDSLDAIKISVEATKYNIKVSAQSFYKYPTINLLVKYALNKVKTNLNTTSAQEETFSIKKDKPYNIDGNILLTGATGFLGSHILYELLKQTDKNIYCLIRGSSTEIAKKRLIDRLHCYFADRLDCYFDNRIIIVKGDFTKDNIGLSKNDYLNLSNNISCIINTAATVKHIGSVEQFEATNVLSVKNLITLCKNIPNCQLVHISTLSVAGGNDINGTHDFTEKDLYVNQKIDDNIYIKTKYEAERLLIKELNNNLPVTIFRLGNITWRTYDGIFQYNAEENLFFNLLQYLIKVEEIPENLKNKLFNISPVDECAELIVSILLKENIYNIYHIYNQKEVSLEKLVDLINSLGFNIKFTKDNTSIKTLNEHSDEIFLSSYLYELLNSPNLESPIRVSSPYTDKIIKDLNFNWSNITTNYLKQGLEENLK